VFENRTVKDIMTHLFAWHELFFQWYKDGMAGQKPEIPAPGYTFKTTPELNAMLYQKYKDLSFKDAKTTLNSTHKKIMALISKHTDEELTENKLYKWTGTTNLASYFASATSSHYTWSNSLLKKFLKR
jgi:hypothetical protein